MQPNFQRSVIMEERIIDFVLAMTIEELDCSVRLEKCLARAGIRTVKDLTMITRDQLMNLQNSTKKICEEAEQKLASLGLSLKKESEG